MLNFYDVTKNSNFQTKWHIAASTSVGEPENRQPVQVFFENDKW